MTTATAIWMAAALGMAAATGMYIVALSGELLTFGLLELVPRTPGEHTPHEHLE